MKAFVLLSILSVVAAIDITYQSYTTKWWGNIVNRSTYSGDMKNSITRFRANLSSGNVIYCVHVKSGGWLGEVKNRSSYA